MTLTVVKWLGTFCTLAGALATAFTITPLNILLFLVGSVLWIYAAIEMDDRPLYWVNLGLLCIYIVGLLVRLYGQ